MCMKDGKKVSMQQFTSLSKVFFFFKFHINFILFRWQTVQFNAMLGNEFLNNSFIDHFMFKPKVTTFTGHAYVFGLTKVECKVTPFSKTDLSRSIWRKSKRKIMPG